MNTPLPPSTRLPAGFHLWWAVSTLHAAGSSMLAFAMIWLATDQGPAAVAVVSTVSVLPALCLLLFGGALGDRHGPRRMLVATTLVQLVVLLGLLVLVGDDPGVVGLAAAAGLLSVISAFKQPAAIVFPRLLIRGEEQFSRALARISGSTHIARILGVSAGGIVISVWPLTALLTVCAVLAGLSLVVLPVLRPATPAPTPTPTGGERRAGLGRALSEGIRSAHALRIWPLLAAVALVCAAVLPVVAVVLPSAARARGWSGVEAGAWEAAWATGTLAVTLLISFTGTSWSQHRALIGGPLLMMVALILLALPLALPVMLCASALLGVGTALFTTHIAPLLLRRAPAGQMTRFQSLMAIVQLAPAALLNSPFAALAGNGHAWIALLLAAALAGSAALLVTRDTRSMINRDPAPTPPPAPRAATRGPS